MVLFTHLKIILLQCFQFLVFSFQQNKLYPNGPYIHQIIFVSIFLIFQNNTLSSPQPNHLLSNSKTICLSQSSIARARSP